MITLERGSILDKERVRKILEKRTDYTENQKYYRGNQAIEDRTMTDTTKPNNKLINSFAAYITDVNVGYFMGQPVSYSSTNQQLMDKIQEIFDYNDEQDENVQLAMDASICGVAYELMYMDEESNIRFNRVSPLNMVVIYDTSITPEPWAALRVYSSGNTDTELETDIYIEIYTESMTTLYKTDKVFSIMTEISSMENLFGQLPVSVFANNDTFQGDFDKVKSLIDEYDLAQSDTANDFEYFTDAYLHLHNIDLSTDEIQKLKEKRVIQTEGDAAGLVEWVVKEIQDAATENFKNRLQADIHRFSRTPNLTDESFAGNLSGIALSYKLLGMEWNASTKERKFKRGLQNRLLLITAMLEKKGSPFDYKEVKIEFNRNLPQNVQEITEWAVSLKGIVSDQTILSILPFIDDPQEELDRLEQEAKDSELKINPRGSVDVDADQNETTGEEQQPR